MGQEFFSICGLALLTVLSVTLLIGTFGWSVDKLKNLFQHMTYRSEAKARKELGIMIALESYWFSESTEVMMAIRALGEAITNHHDGLYNISDVRNQWREKLKV